MVSLRVNGNEVQLLGGTSFELQRNSPLFSASGSLDGEYSTPITIPYTQANARALGLPFHYVTERSKTYYDCELWESGRFRARGKLVVEAGVLNLNEVQKNNLSGYLLLNLSSFYQNIKNKKLRQLAFPQTDFDWTTEDPTDASDGFWQHVHETWTTDDAPWRFFPVRNEVQTEGIDWFNKMSETTAEQLDYNINIAYNRLFPFFQLKYVLQTIFENEDYVPDFSDLAGTDWDLIYMFSNVPQDWFYRDYSYTEGVGYSYSYIPKTVISIRPARHLPNTTVSDFLLQVSQRYGIEYIFDYGLRTVRVVALRNTLDKPIEDITQYVEPVLEPFLNTGQIFAFSNAIDSNDQFNSEPSLSDVQTIPPKASAAALPTPSPSYENKVCFCFKENTFYQCVYDDTVFDFAWNIYGYNIGGYDPNDSTETIDSSVYSTAVLKSLYRTGGGDAFGYFPAVGYERDADFGYTFWLWHGMVPDVNASNATTGNEYPYASAHRNTIDGSTSLTWSNVLQHEFDNVDYGIIKYWYSVWLKLIRNTEQITARLNMPLGMLKKLSWDTIVLVKNVPYLMMNVTEPVPYTKQSQVVLRRLNKSAIFEEDPKDDIFVSLSLRGYTYPLIDEVQAQFSIDEGATWEDIGVPNVYDTTGALAGIFSVPYGSKIWIAVLKASDYSNIAFGFFGAVYAACGKNNPAKPGVYTSDTTLEYFIAATSGGNVIACP